jgi:hypothetical protein
MPAQDSLRLNDLHSTKQARPKPSNPNEQRTITATQSKTRPCLSRTDGELMAKKDILCLEPALRFEQVGGEPSERMEDRKHRSQS